MATFQSIKELTRGLQQGAKLLGDMFMKRKTIAIRYDDALDTFDGDENRLCSVLFYFSIMPISLVWVSDVSSVALTSSIFRTMV